MPTDPIRSNKDQNDQIIDIREFSVVLFPTGKERRLHLQTREAVYTYRARRKCDRLLAFTFAASLPWVFAVVLLFGTINMSQNYSEIVQ